MRKLLLLMGLTFVFSTLTLFSSCNRGTGCPATESAHVRPNRKGELPTSGGKTSLFPKDFNKKKKRKRRN
jgi:hypothetical protein